MTDRLTAAVAELVAALRAEVAEGARPTSSLPERLLSVDEAAAVLSIGRTALYGLVGSGTLRSVRVGRRRLIAASAITDLTAQSRESES